MVTRHAPSLALTNADLGRRATSTVRISGSLISSTDDRAKGHDHVADLAGARVFPGLINAHDHLQLNSLPPLAFNRRYKNVRGWIADVDSLRKTDAAFERHVAMPRGERLFVGGLKNLLAGVTTVAHHDPIYPELLDPGFPVRVVNESGWSHSLYLDGEDVVRAAHHATPPHQPWIIHAGEGVDAEAAAEFQRLEAIGCLRPNTILIHGVALSQSEQRRMSAAGAGLVWCPSSNREILDFRADFSHLVEVGSLALGTDSRLSGTRDLLDELRVAAESDWLPAMALEPLVTSTAARLLRLPDRGSLEAGKVADLLVAPAGAQLGRMRRADVLLVMVNGVALYGEAGYADRVDPAAHWEHVRVDGRAKLLRSSVAERLRGAQVIEPGLELLHSGWRVA